MKQKILAAAALALLAGGCYFLPSQPATNVAPVPADVTPARIESTPAAIPATPLPAPTGAAIRVQFESGSYGTTLTGTVGTNYLLWAAAGQTLTVTLRSDQSVLASLYSVGGQPLYEQMAAGNTARANLVASGDHTLQIQATGAYTVGVEIR